MEASKLLPISISVAGLGILLFAIAQANKDKNGNAYLNQGTFENSFNAKEIATVLYDAMKEAIFERGVTTKTESGHGYGMYLINRYVTYAGGYITIDDNEAQGTIISIFIPIQSEAQNETV